jgi:hypothetical protein
MITSMPRSTSSALVGAQGEDVAQKVCCLTADDPVEEPEPLGDTLFCKTPLQC